MKKMITTFAIMASFSSFASSQYAIIGDSCWKCVGGKFKTGKIECTPERTARLYETNMRFCDTQSLGRGQSEGYNSYSDGGVLVNPQSSSKDRVISRINELERELNQLKKQL